MSESHEVFICDQCDLPYCTCSRKQHYCEYCGRVICEACFNDMEQEDQGDNSPVCGDCWEDWKENERINKRDEELEDSS